MKKLQKLLSVILAIAIVFTTTSFVGFAATGDAYIENGKYYHYTFGEYQECYLDYIEMIEELQKDVLQHITNVEVYHCFYAVEGNVDRTDNAEVKEAQYNLEKKIERSLFTHNDDNPKLGEYLYDSGEIYCSANIRTNDYDVEINGVHYDVYGITLEADHLLTAAEEDYISKFAEVFSEAYISPNASDYDKVKTIYDFVVRNTAYDEELFTDKVNKYPKSSDRFRISHSAYGAIMGNMLTYDKSNVSMLDSASDINRLYDSYESAELKAEYIDAQVRYDFDLYFDYKIAVNDEKIIKLKSKNGGVIHNGLAVCEGYSKLFYYLCEYNGITSRIVDGDYIEYIVAPSSNTANPFGNEKSGKASDPHEWNYVYLDDNTGKGKQWFIVDATWGSQLSLPNIDYNSYDYFLIGTKYTPDGNVNPYFSIKNHQQPYVQDGPIPQLYNWYEKANQASEMDYDIPLIDLGCFEFNDDDSVIIERKTAYADGEKCAYILQGKDSAVKITIDEDAKLTENVGGFDYNGKNNAEYMLIIPYLTGYEYQSEILTGVSKAGTYTVKSTGMIVDGRPTEFSVKFKIMPVDMSNNSSNYSEIEIENEAYYSGNEIVPSVSITDGYGNKLTSNDYTIKTYQNGTIVPLVEMGTYEVRIVFKGNYKGTYNIDFKIGKINLNHINLEQYKLPYLPEYYRNKDNLKTAADFFNDVSSLKVGTQNLVNGTDYVVSSSGTISSYGDTGTLTIKAATDSEKVEAGTKKTGSYIVSQKFSISTTDTTKNGHNLNGQYADSNKTNQYFYDGTAKKPTSFDNLDKMLVKGKDYKIKSYSNNVNAGTASVVIEGINGCTGTATMYYVINPASITTAKVSATMSGTTLNVVVTWNGKTLVKGTDYSLSTEKTSSTSYLVTIKGKNNFAGTLKVSLTVADPSNNYVKPTASGNKLKLSKNSYVYSGSACKPTVTLINGNGKAISTHYYTVKYSNNTNVGTAKITITYRNGYSGTFKTTFAIVPKSTTISSLSAISKGFNIKWKKQATQTTGYQIQIATDSKFTKGVKTYAVGKNSTVSTKITKLTGKKKYYVRIRTYKTVSGKSYCSAWSASKHVTTKG